MPRVALACCCLLAFGAGNALGQRAEPAISTFGYFQTTFRHENDSEGPDADNSFSAQQLNLFFQTDLSHRWRAFVDFELLNNFSSSRRWGSFNLNEAWLRFRAGEYLSVKVGLHVPPFNHLNEIKNRTPLLPYVIRPLVYEESFGETIAVEEFVPERAFLQASGFLGRGEVKLDYAAYLGNSPNINSQYDNERKGGSFQTGIDTTTALLVGGRLGLRYGFDVVKLGVSATRESVNFLTPLEPSLGLPTHSLSGIPKTRLGADLSFRLHRLTFEGEAIVVRHAIDEPDALRPAAGHARARLDLERSFYYGTLGYHVTERLFVYGSYWYSNQTFVARAQTLDLIQDVDITVPTAGLRYTLVQDGAGFDRITLKAQYAYARVESADVERFGAAFVREADQNQRLNFFAAAVSVLF